MDYLSRHDIEKIAEQVISQYKAAYIPTQCMCYTIDVIKLASMLGYKIEYVYITLDGSILGQTSSGRVWTTIYDDSMNQMYFELDGFTILVDKRLQNEPKFIGRKNFTIAHEIAHQILNRQCPEMYNVQSRTFCDYRRSSKSKKVIVDWIEWQADALAAALLLPLDVLLDSMFVFGLGKKMKMISRKYSSTNFSLFCEMADYLQVSRTALSYRMEQFGLLDNNRLVIEAENRRKGVA